MNRYIGLQPFTEKQKDLFFGRDTEIEKIFQLIYLENIVVLYSKPGYGKTSLLKAGIIPKIKQNSETNSLVLYFDFKNYLIEKNVSVLQQLINEINDRVSPKNFYLDKILKTSDIPNEILWYYLKSVQNWLNKDEIIFIFDHFECFFTYPEQQINEFKEQLSTVLFTKIPQPVRDIINTFLIEKKDVLNENEINALYNPLKIKVLISIQQGKLSLLNKLRNYIPGILQNVYEIHELRFPAVEEVICDTASVQSPELDLNPPFIFSTEALKKIYLFFDLPKKNVEPYKIQIIGQFIENNIINKKQINLPKKVVLDTDLPDIENIYSQYYLNVINKLPDAYRLKARKLIEEGLLFNNELELHIKHEKDLMANFEVDKNLLDKLVDIQLLKTEKSGDDNSFFCINYEFLIPAILKAKKEREDFDMQQKIKYENEQRLIKTKRRIYIYALTLIVVLSIAFSVFLGMQNKKIRNQQITISDQKERIERLKDAEEIFIRTIVPYIDSTRHNEMFLACETAIDTMYKKKQFHNLVFLAQTFTNFYKKIKASDKIMAEAYGNWAWYCILVTDYNKAIEKAKQGIEYDENVLWVKENLAIAYWCSGQDSLGTQKYNEIKDSIFHDVDISPEGIKFKQQFQNDIKKLIMLNAISDKDTAKIKRLVELN